MINIQTIKDGERFTRHGCGTNETFYEITQQEYDRVTSIEGYQGELNREYEEKMDDCIRWGYGFYGCRLARNNETGKCYYVVCIGNSCD